MLYIRVLQKRCVCVRYFHYGNICVSGRVTVVTNPHPFLPQRIVVWQDKLNSYYVRMQNMKVSIKDRSSGNVVSDCGGGITLSSSMTREDQTYSVSCSMACGNQIELMVDNSGDDNCIHIRELEAFTRGKLLVLGEMECSFIRHCQ